MKNNMRLWGTIIGVVLSVVLIGGGWMVVRQFTRADDSIPREVIVSTITANNATISWSTGVATQGVIEYGTSPTSLNFFAPEAQNAVQHEVQLTLLSPSTTYYFQIKVGDAKYDNGGVPWTFATKSTDDASVGTSNTPTDAPVASPTPIQRLTIPDNSGPAPAASCTETDCEKIKAKFGTGCSTQDYIKCLKRK